ncbi:MAG: hypothetical protein RDV41_12135 [Planctomycetota bacterium]|nr:hypothetical protein [Planctomycetota bacterium]
MAETTARESTASTFAPLLTRFGEVRSKVRLLFALHGAGMVLGVACIAAAVSLLIDWSIIDLPVPVRLVILLLCASAVGYTAMRYLVYPLRRRISDDDIAVCIERAYPDLRDRLISSVQLSREAENAMVNSPVLVRMLVTETMGVAGGLDFSATVSPGAPLRIVIASVVLFLGTVVYAALYPDVTAIWLNRLFGGSARWPKKTSLSVDLQDETLVARGDTFRATVRVGGKIPTRVSAVTSYESGAIIREVLDRAEGKSEFQLSIPRVQESFGVYFEGGDDRTRDFKVVVLPAPRIDRVCLLYTFPKYMGLAHTNPDVPVEGGNIKAPIGTVVKVMGTSNIPLESGRVLIGRHDQEQALPTTLGKDLEKGEGHLLVASLEIMSDTEYVFQVTATNKLTCRDPVRYQVRVIADNAPVLKVLEPNADKMVTPEATVVVKTQVSDDFGVSQVSLAYTHASGETKVETRVNYDSSHNDAKYGEKTIGSECALDMPLLAAKPGDSISYIIEARDNRDKPEPNMTASRVYVLTVVARDQMQRLAEERQQRIREELRRLIEAQKSERKNTDQYDMLLSPKPELEPSERQMLQSSAAAQRQIGQRLERLSREMAEIVSDAVANKLWDLPAQERLGAMQKKMIDTAAKCPEAANMVAQAAMAPAQEERADSISAVGVKQDEILADLGELYGQMEEWEDYADIVRQMRELLDRHREMMRAIEGQQPK